MNHAKMLDCTLRDGAYLVDKKFGHNTIKGIVKGLVDAGIDCIEIGFFQDDGFGEGKTVFKNSKEAQKYVPSNKGKSMFTVLADYSRYSIENLDYYDEGSIDAVRACFFKNERHDVLDFCRQIKQKGYKLFVQPVDILGYSDSELLELLDDVNKLEPYCMSIVDTFGSMYEDDLQRVFSIVNHNLNANSMIGFHSHNNMQMSSALSQAFLQMSHGKRKVVVDTTICGMGRGAGNTPTELIVQYMNQKLGYCYNMDALLDLIDNYMNQIKAKCTWGYSIPYFIAGCYGAHVNNISYLLQKNSIQSKDIRYILNKIDEDARKRYEYDLLEQIYIDFMKAEYDDSDDIMAMEQMFVNEKIVMIAPGATSSRCVEKICNYIEEENAIVIAINFVPAQIPVDYVYFSNIRRYQYWKNSDVLDDKKLILASNIEAEGDFVVSFPKLIKCGWTHVDNSALMLLRLLDMLPIMSVAIAGLDGYDAGVVPMKNYADPEMEVLEAQISAWELNQEIQEMLSDFLITRKSSYPISFLTESRFEI